MIKSILAFFGYVPKFNEIEKVENKIRETRKKLNSLQKYVFNEAVRLDKVWEAGGNDYQLQEYLNIDRSLCKELESELVKLESKLNNLYNAELHKNSKKSA